MRIWLFFISCVVLLSISGGVWAAFGAPYTWEKSFGKLYWRASPTEWRLALLGVDVGIAEGFDTYLLSGGYEPLPLGSFHTADCPALGCNPVSGALPIGAKLLFRKRPENLIVFKPLGYADIGLGWYATPMYGSWYANPVRSVVNDASFCKNAVTGYDFYPGGPTTYPFYPPFDSALAVLVAKPSTSVSVSHTGSTAGLNCTPDGLECIVLSRGDVTTSFTFSATYGNIFFGHGSYPWNCHVYFDVPLTTTPNFTPTAPYPPTFEIPARTITQVIRAPYRPPENPYILGPNFGAPNTAYGFLARTSDPDEEAVKFGIDWNANDGVNAVDEWIPATGYVNPNIPALGQTEISFSKTWAALGDKTFKVIVEDKDGYRSPGWTTQSMFISDVLYVYADEFSWRNTGETFTIHATASGGIQPYTIRTYFGGAAANGAWCSFISGENTLNPTISCSLPGRSSYLIFEVDDPTPNPIAAAGVTIRTYAYPKCTVTADKTNVNLGEPITYTVNYSNFKANPLTGSDLYNYFTCQDGSAITPLVGCTAIPNLAPNLVYYEGTCTFFCSYQSSGVFASAARIGKTSEETTCYGPDVAAGLSVSCNTVWNHWWTTDIKSPGQGGNITWRATLSGGTPPYTYTWAGDDGLSHSSTTTWTQSSVDHQYTAAGNYTAGVMVADSSSPKRNGAAACSTAVYKIMDCNATPSTALTGQNVTWEVFYSPNILSQGGVYGFELWSGDIAPAPASSVRKFTRSYSTTGTKNATVRTLISGEFGIYPLFAYCSAVITGPVDGVCGPAESNRPYAFDASGFVGDFCSGGDAPLVPPAFPPRGGVTGWTCLGRSGGDDATCSASRYLGPVAVGNEVAISIGSSRAEYDVPAPIVLTVTLSRFSPSISGVTFSVVENDLRGGSKDIVQNQSVSFGFADDLVVQLAPIATESYSPGNYEYVAIITSVHAGETVLGDNIAKAQVALVRKQTAAPELDLFFVAVVALFVVAIISRGK